MSEDTETKCPSCGSRVEYFPDQDGSCDYQCLRCGWSEHVPSSENVAATLTLRKGDRAETEPTIVVFVEAGVVQGIEGNAPVRVILCGFDCTEEEHRVAGRPCHIGVWESPEDPSEEFTEVLSLVERMD